MAHLVIDNYHHYHWHHRETKIEICDTIRSDAIKLKWQRKCPDPDYGKLNIEEALEALRQEAIWQRYLLPQKILAERHERASLTIKNLKEQLGSSHELPQFDSLTDVIGIQIRLVRMLREIYTNKQLKQQSYHTAMHSMQTESESKELSSKVGERVLSKGLQSDEKVIKPVDISASTHSTSDILMSTPRESTGGNVVEMAISAPSIVTRESFSASGSRSPIQKRGSKYMHSATAAAGGVYADSDHISILNTPFEASRKDFERLPAPPLLKSSSFRFRKRLKIHFRKKLDVIDEVIRIHDMLTIEAAEPIEPFVKNEAIAVILSLLNYIESRLRFELAVDAETYENRRASNDRIIVSQKNPIAKPKHDDKADDQ